MPHADFVHLRVHTAYSLAEGAIKIKDLITQCAAARMPAVAITDSANMFGALEFATVAAEAGVQPIIGCQINIRAEVREERGRLAVVGGTGHVSPPPDQLVLLAQSEAGYQNLIALVSQAYLDTDPGEAPQIDVAQLAARADGLIALTGGPAGPVNRLLAGEQTPAARATLETLRTIFPNRLYVELQRHGLAGETAVEEALLDLAYELDVPLVATNDCYFADRAMYEAHDALLCIAQGVTVSHQHRRRVTPEHGFKSAEDMRALFADLPEAVDNSLIIAQRCAYMPTKRATSILPPYDTDGGRDEDEELRAQARAGLEARLAVHVFTPDMDAAACVAASAPYRERLEMELDIIIEMGFSGYFLIVADFIQWAKDRAIPVGPGRGSGAGSAVAWALKITDLDPLRWGLLFERFLNPERVSMPDFDIDFCQDRRDEVIHYVQEKYGSDRVAQIITFGKLQARAVLRDVGRVLEMPYGQVDRICKLVPNNPANPVTLAEAIAGEPELRQQRDADENVGQLIAIALQLEGLYRHASTHAAGVVIGDRPLDQLVALYRDQRSEMPATQFNMKWVEIAGLVKFDFLGLKTLSVLSRAVELVSATRGVSLDLAGLPLDDPKTFELLSRGDTIGVFQLEGAGMRDTLKKLRPDRFEDIIALVSLYRPGPMANIPKYIACKHGEEDPDYMHPKLEPVLTETFGIMIYQEQVQRAAQVLAGYTLGGADKLRRAMGKKIKAEMDAQRDTFVQGATDNGVDGRKASEIFDQIAAFAGYGFNKSHAAAYALIAYQTAYLKAHYPVEFLAASMTYDMGNTDKLNVFRQELQAARLPLLGPDINRSETTFSVEKTEDGYGVRFALAAIKNVGAAAMDALVAERRGKGAFKDLSDFANRVDARVANKRLLENLARAGAFDSLLNNRARLHENVDAVLRHATAAAQDRGSNQVSLFAASGGADLSELRLRDRPEWPPLERLGHEFEALGFYLSAHPLDSYGRTLERLGVVPVERLAATIAQQRGETARVKVAGVVVSAKLRTSARGNRFAFVALTDQSGVFEITVFSEVLAQTRDLLEAGTPVLISANATIEDDAVKLLAQRIEALDKAVEQTAAGMLIHIRDNHAIAGLSGLMGQQKRGRGMVKIVVDTAEREVVIPLPESYQISAATRAAVKSLPGVVEVQEI
ncbi:MAG: DNA polymerase III subunit alpha [Pseudomonadota bacterium]|nr:DNA polymerase III subunit alpha [Pseudomonadota bacterium]